MLILPGKSSSWAAAGGFVPTDLATLEAWWDFTDTSVMYTDLGTTNVSTNGDTVEYVDDKSTNGYDLQREGASSTVTWDSANGQVTLGDDALGILKTASMTLPSTVEIYFAIKLTDPQTSDQAVMLYESNTEYAGGLRTTGTSGQFLSADQGLGTIAYHVADGAAIDPDARGALDTAFVTGSGLVANMRGLAFDASSVAEFFGFNSSSEFCAGALTHIVIVDGAITSGDRTDLIDYLTARVPA